MRDLIRRQARGEKLHRRERKALGAHLEACPACRAEARLDVLLAETISHQPTVTPSSSFAANVLAALPALQPVALPEPSFRWVWGWAAGGVGLAGAVSWGVWVFREQWLGWLFNTGTGATIEATAFFYQIQNNIAHVHFPIVSIAITALIAFTAWGATALAQPSR
jgi:hypothetical protein